ncbi:MAG TPA: OmpA family protein [Ferruginibacter sp.]|nr:OmpA family protein [Ferruginibacter sp.]
MIYLSTSLRIVTKLFLLSLVLFQFIDVSAQVNTRLSIMAGAGNTSLNSISNSIEDKSRYSSITSGWGGLSADVPLIHGFSVFTTLTYNKRGYKYALHNQNGATNTIKDSTYKQSLNYIDLNLNLIKKFTITEKLSIFLGTGPSLSLFLSGKEELYRSYFSTTVPSSKITRSNLTVGNDAGAYKRVFFSLASSLGFEFNKFAIWVNYNSPLDFYYLDAKNKLQHKLTTYGINASYVFPSFTPGEKEKREKREKRARKERSGSEKAIVKDTLTDTDGDGITDINDRCPGHKGTAKYGGCPIPDTDGDGLNDDVDKCPLVEGDVSNAGCPAFKDTEKPSTKDTLRFTVYFEPGKSILRTGAYNTLTEVVKALKANSKLQVLFNGHTDNVGSVEANSIRAFDRASVCADYVASFYIDRSRLVVAAYGNKLPAADLADPLMQWKNRRVEILVFEK